MRRAVKIKAFNRSAGQKLKEAFALVCLVLMLLFTAASGMEGRALSAKSAKSEKSTQKNKNTNSTQNKKNTPKGKNAQSTKKTKQTAMFSTGGLLQVVNKKSLLGKDYEPEDIVLPKVPTRKRSLSKAIYMRKQAAQELESMFLSAGVEKGYTLHAVSGYRTYGIQQLNFSAKMKDTRSREKAAQLVAPPGSSEHQTGLAMDIQAEGFNKLNADFEKRAEGKWLKDNAHRFGFILRYPKDKVKITGFSFEPWHFRFVTRAHAGAIYSLRLCLEEYASVAQRFPEYVLQNATDKALIGLYNELLSGNDEFISLFEKSSNKEEALRSFTQKYLDGEDYERAYMRCFPERIPEKEAPKYEDEDIELFKDN